MSEIEKPSDVVIAQQIEKLRALWDEGVASGISAHHRTADEISWENRRRLTGPTAAGLP